MICGKLVMKAGIIPADAGSTTPGPKYTKIATDHPRGCGEHPADDPVWESMRGSSPRMRGARSPMFSKRTTLGIIPADAGSTLDHVESAGNNVDHPRGCGEHYDRWAAMFKARGSSPRMRGAQWCAYRRLQARRIIPADAGSTPSPIQRSCATRDHPRGCGEHVLTAWIWMLTRGSSPRMRGAHYVIGIRI